MSNITQIHDPSDAAYRYEHGDIGRALAEGLKYEQIAADI